MLHTSDTFTSARSHTTCVFLLMHYAPRKPAMDCLSTTSTDDLHETEGIVFGQFVEVSCHRACSHCVAVEGEFTFAPPLFEISFFL